MAVFVMMPYKDEFRKTYNTSILPAVEECHLKSILPEDEQFAGPIDQKITEFIKASEICIADLSESNPNVMYEVALAHSLEKPVILITRGKIETIPFDIRHHRVITYIPTTDGHTRLYKDLLSSLKATQKFEELPTTLLKQMLVPDSIGKKNVPYVVAACPLSFRAAFKARGGWKQKPLTYSDHVGIRGLMQSFGLIYGLHRLPELIDPDDFDDKVIERSMHLYSIASPKANRWTGIMMAQFFEKREPRWDFRPDPESPDLQNPKVLVRFDSKPYLPVKRGKGGRLRWDFGLVIRGPNPFDSNCLFMALAGRSALGTGAACLAATDPDCLEKLIHKLKEDKVDLDDHTRAFCAVVSIQCHPEGPGKGVDKDTFKVADISIY